MRKRVRALCWRVLEDGAGTLGGGSHGSPHGCLRWGRMEAGLWGRGGMEPKVEPTPPLPPQGCAGVLAHPICCSIPKRGPGRTWGARGKRGSWEERPRCGPSADTPGWGDPTGFHADTHLPLTVAACHTCLLLRLVPAVQWDRPLLRTGSHPVLALVAAPKMDHFSLHRPSFLS